MNNCIQYFAKDIAPFFIKKGVSPLKLQKLLYYSQAWSFVNDGNHLFNDDIKGWIYGPVVPEIWYKFRIMRRSDIIPVNNHFYDLKDNLPSHTSLFLDKIWNAYGHLSGADLVDLTHEERPWKQSRLGLLSNQPGKASVIIDSDTTKDYKFTNSGNIPVAAKPHLLGYFNS